LLKHTAISEMGHIERLAERILFFAGDVTMVAGGPVETITEPPQSWGEPPRRKKRGRGLQQGRAGVPRQRRCRLQANL
jgi:hypothetical protein